VSVPFGPRGSRLWAAYCERVDGEAGIALLEEVCRTADRLDRLDAVLTGEVSTWLNLSETLPDSGEFRVYVDSALSEARQQGQAFSRLLAALPVKAADDDDESWLEGLPPEVRDTPGS
jgi:hypothetical protein